MTVIQDRDVTVPRVALSGEYEVAWICFKCQRVLHRKTVPEDCHQFFWGLWQILFQASNEKKLMLCNQKNVWTEVSLFFSGFGKLIYFSENMFVFLLAHTNTKIADDCIKLDIYLTNNVPKAHFLLFLHAIKKPSNCHSQWWVCMWCFCHFFWFIL